MKVTWSGKAKARLLEIREYIARDSPVRASQMVDRLTRRSAELAELPRIDRRVPEYDDDYLRELLERPYRIIYFVGEHELSILTIKHFRQRLPRVSGDL